MLENLRDQASFQPEEEPPDPNPPKPPRVRKPRRSLDQISGMTAKQRFIVAFMLAIVVCMLGVVLLLITGSMVPPAIF